MHAAAGGDRASTGLAPWLAVRDADAALAYYKAAFGAVDLERLEDDAGDLQVAQLWIGGAEFWIQTDPAADPEGGHGSIRLILSVDDPDAVFTRALDSGATEISPVAEGNGWRVGRVTDPFGHQWEIGRRLAP
jgi:PhnB protein